MGKKAGGKSNIQIERDLEDRERKGTEKWQEKKR